MALCLILMFGRFGAMAFSNIVGVMLADNCDGVFYLICGLLIGEFFGILGFEDERGDVLTSF